MSFTNQNCLLTVVNDEKDLLGLKFQMETKEQCRHCRDAWIPSQSTRMAFFKPSNTIDRELLTMPGLSSHDNIVVGGVHNDFQNLDKAYNEILATRNITEDKNGVCELIQIENYQAALVLIGKLLTDLGQGVGKKGSPSQHTELSVQLWYTRLALLVKLGELKTADIEASVWWDCDRPDLYYQYYPERYKNQIGTMVPFQMRLLLAVLPGHCGRHSEALQRLFSIIATVKEILENLSIGRCVDGSQLQKSACDYTESKELWTARYKRIHIAVVNIALEMQDFLLALEVMNKLLENENREEAKQVLYSVSGRISLQLGDLQQADKFFNLARSLNTMTEDLDFEHNVNQAFMAIANNNYEDAFKSFEKASLIDPSSIMVMNNCAVCLVYMKHLKEAIRLLSGTIANNPKKALHNSLLLNLCSMFELESSYNWNKKFDLLKLVGRFKGDSINTSSLKLL